METILRVIANLFINPLELFFLLILFGLFFKRYFKSIIIFATIYLFLMSYHPINNFLLEHLEKKYENYNIDDINISNIKYALLLGGNIEDRGYKALELFNKNKNLTIITSGFMGSAIKSATILQKCGIPKNHIIMLTKPENTRQEAMFVKKIVKNDRFFLVTSAYHMPRAMIIFKKQGLKALPYQTQGKYFPSYVYTYPPSGIELEKMQIVLHEYIGILWEFLDK